MRQRPLLLWAASFAAGIGLGAASWLPLPALFCLSALGLIGLFWGRAPLLFPLSLLLLGLSAGGLRLTAFQTCPGSDLSHWSDRLAPVTITGTVLGDPETRRGGRLTFFLRAETLQTQNVTVPVSGDLSVGLSPDAARGLSLDYGDRVRLEGALETPRGATNPGAFSWRDYLARRGIYCQIRVKRHGDVTTVGATRLNPFVHLAWHVRRVMLKALHTSLPPTQSAVLGGILIGYRTDLPPDLMSDFVKTGTVHILASAGLHVGIVAFWLEWLCRRLTLPRKWGAALSIATLWLYALMAGGRPSVTRAVLMATLYLVAVLFEREPDLPTSVGAAALVILLLQPTALLEPGFQMSFLTILTLAIAMPVWNSLWQPRIIASFPSPRTWKAALWGVQLIGLSLFAQIGSLPIVASDYHEISLMGWLANLLIVPTLFLLIPLGFAGALLWGIWHAAGTVVLSTAGWGITRLVAVVRAFGENPWASRAVPAPPVPFILCYYLVFYGGIDALARHLTLPLDANSDHGSAALLGAEPTVLSRP